VQDLLAQTSGLTLSMHVHKVKVLPVGLYLPVVCGIVDSRRVHTYVGRGSGEKLLGLSVALAAA